MTAYRLAAECDQANGQQRQLPRRDLDELLKHARLVLRRHNPQPAGREPHVQSGFDLGLAVSVTHVEPENLRDGVANPAPRLLVSAPSAGRIFAKAASVRAALMAVVMVEKIGRQVSSPAGQHCKRKP